MNNAVLMAHLNPMSIENGVLRVDRKFHTGMLDYARHLPHDLITVNPLAVGDQPIMDAIEVPVSELPYNPHVVRTNGSPEHVHADDRAKLQQLILRADLVYGCGLDIAKIARYVRIPYILVLEYDLQTQLKILEGSGILRRTIRSARCVRDYWKSTIPQARGAHGVHCNGYPIFEALDGHNSNRLLYLDSRMSASQVISEDMLEKRLRSHQSGPLRLLYSGRYERLKGADDAVRVAIACLKNGVEVEIDCYGQGNLKGEMQESARGWPQIRIHDAIPYPNLVEVSREADAFLCCHVQNDPSCTYIESMGSGLPIIGYANRMWSGLLKQSAAGVSARIGNINEMVDAISALGASRGRLATLSRRARLFAMAHCFEREFEKRVSSISMSLLKLSRAS